MHAVFVCVCVCGVCVWGGVVCVIHTMIENCSFHEYCESGREGEGEGCLCVE